VSVAQQCSTVLNLRSTGHRFASHQLWIHEGKYYIIIIIYRVLIITIYCTGWPKKLSSTESSKNHFKPSNYIRFFIKL